MKRAKKIATKAVIWTLSDCMLRVRDALLVTIATKPKVTVS